MMRMRYNIITRRYFPPGFDYQKEWKRAFCLLGIGMGLSLQFFVRLYNAVGELYQYEVDQQNEKWIRVLKEGVMAKPFWHLVKGHIKFYIPYFLFLVAMVFCHYLYYYSTEKCIYLMRRLPKRGAFIKSCVQFPLFGVVLGTACLAVLYLLYYMIYFIVIPRGCLP